MRKGKQITITIESIERGTGVITAENISATVLYGSGDHVTVKGEDGYIYEIDANIRTDNDGYKVL